MKNEQNKRFMGLDKASIRLLSVNALRVATIGGGIWAVLLNLYVLRLGYDAIFVGILAGVTQVAVVAMGLMAGPIARRYPMKLMYTASIAVGLISSLLLPLGEMMGSAQTAWILAMRVLAGASMGTFFFNYHPMLTVTAPLESRRQVFSINAALGPFGGFAGSLLGGWLPALFATLLNTTLDSAAPYRWALVTGALLCIPALILALQTADKQPTMEAGDIRSEKLPANAGGIISALVAVSILRLIGENAAKTYLNVYMDTVLHTPTAMIGIIAAVGQLAAAPTALLAPRLSAKKGLVPTVSWGAFGAGIGLATMAAWPSAMGAALGFLIVNASAQMGRPAYLVFGQEVLGAKWRQFLSGITTASASVGSTIASFGGGWLATTTSYAAVFSVGALASVAGGVVFWSYFRTPRGAYAQAEQTLDMDIS